MAIVVGAIYMCVGWLAALVASRNDCSVDTFAQALIEHKVFAFKFRGNVQLFYLLCVLDNATIELCHIFEAIVDEKCAGLFASYATCAIQ